MGNMLSPQERDLFLSCGEIISSITLSSLLNKEGIPAIALTGWQAGIITDRQFSRAQIISIQPEPIRKILAERKVAVVCGFQGVTPEGEITTLGRGGSDTTATALGISLEAEYVDIFTDVEGIMTADPRIVKEATHLERISYHEICNLAYEGAKVIHPRAVELAMQKNIPIRIRSTMSSHSGTLITTEAICKELNEDIAERLITGVTQKSNLSQIKITAEIPQFDLHVKFLKPWLKIR